MPIELRYGPSQHKAGELCESNASQQIIVSLEKPAVQMQSNVTGDTNRRHTQGARPKDAHNVRLPRVSQIVALASSTPDMTLTRLANVGFLPPPGHFENKFEALINGVMNPHMW